jgi:hypothetical protein
VKCGVSGLFFKHLHKRGLFYLQGFVLNVGMGRKSKAIVESVGEAQESLNYRYIEKRKPKQAALALDMLAAGETYAKVMEATGIGFVALSALRARHERALEVRRKELALDGFEMAERMRALVAKKTEMLMEDDEALMKTPLKDLTLSYGISVDKGLQALGEQKVVVEHRAGKPSLADAMKAIEEARAALQKEAIPVETTIVEPSIVEGVGSESDVDEDDE